MNLSFKQVNSLMGWVTFLIALFTYVSTLEPTVSFWDCGEYIATSVKLQVGHPPGAPVFQLVANVLSQLAFGDVSRQAFYVNMVSGLSSAFTIPFLFWTITMLGRKLFATVDISKGQEIILIGSGLVGALAFTFSDSFWFSAVEGEVYAMSSCFTAIAFWAVLKWESVVDSDEYANRWLLLIAYLTGLSVGIHILVFLTIPSVVMIYFYKKFPEVNWKKWVLANAASIGILALVFAVIIPFVLSLFGWLEITAVNSLSMPKNSGSFIAVLLLGGFIYFGIRWAKRNNRPLISQGIHALVFLLIGYSSFIVLAVRSNANTPIDENNPEDAMALLSYYNRDQYGDWPILFGQSFNSQLDSKKPYTDGPPAYAFSKESGEYEITNNGKASKPNYSKNDISFFPRMWSDQANHVENYQKLMGVKKTDKLEFKDHFRFFMDYQVGQMWFRYFMWNFSGRQNDDQNRYELTKGNWITGISFIDKMRLGPQDNLPAHFLSNPSRNVYFGLPLILGLAGLYFQAKRDKRNAWVVSLLFLFTGLAIVVYTNHKPFEPRERDYAFVGSFYVFAIWIGIGVIAIYEWLGKYRSSISASIITVIALAIPSLMAAQNWDDHDRSDRYTAREIAKMYLNSCEPNAILFTNGDNDTFPLWYVQEVEGYRTDVRIVNLSLLNTDWYIDMMKRKFYDGDAVPFTLEKKDYVQGTRDVLYYQDLKISGRWYAQDFIDYALRNDDGVFFTAFPNTQSPKKLQFFPMKKFRIPVDKSAVISNGVVLDSSKIVDFIDWNWNSNVISKRDLMLIDLISNNNWSRPIYFSTTVGSSASSFFWLQKYFRLEGLAYRFVPVVTEGSGNQFDFGSVNADKMLSVMYNPEGNESKFNFGNMEKPDVFLDETVRRSSFNLRINYGRLASELSRLGRTDEALKVLDFAMEKMPVNKLGYDYFFLNLIEGYYQAGAKERAMNYVQDFSNAMEEELRYYAQFKGSDKRAIQNEIQTDLQFMQMLARMLMQYEYNNEPLTQEEYKNVELIRLYEELAELCS
ncbi:MAG: DUF2723 domain-containing protein [Schleiferiaceae bacterium]|nr:DUF2723 domain-containing protein [Schleiferiaceae bacterium]